MTIAPLRPSLLPRARAFASVIRALLVAASCAAASGLPAPSALGAEGSPYGINIHAPEGADATAQLGQVKALGAGWVRIDFIWSVMEPSRGAYDWRGWDDLVGQCRGAGLEVFATIAGTPAWATDGAEGSGVPRDPQDWVRFCAAAATRYRGSIRTWGMWNEPNLGGFWAGSRQQYIDVILRPGAAAIRGANPDARVVGPELAHLSSAGWYRWLLDVLQQAAGELDVVTHHVYDSSGSGWVTKDLNDTTVFGRNPDLWDLVSPSVREVLDAAHQAGKEFWLTETGWATDDKGETFQANQYTGLLRDWLAGPGPTAWVKKIFFYELRDDGRQGIPLWGICRPDLSQKPAFAAYRDFIAANPIAGEDAAVQYIELPDPLAIGANGRGRIIMRNTGSSSWTREAGYQLAPLSGTELLAPGSLLLEEGRAVPAGSTVTFDFDVTGPQKPGAYTASWRMTRAGGKPFGATAGGSLTVTGTCAAPPSPAIRSAPRSASRPAPSRRSAGTTSSTGTPGSAATTPRWRRRPASRARPSSWTSARRTPPSASRPRRPTPRTTSASRQSPAATWPGPTPRRWSSRE